MGDSLLTRARGVLGLFPGRGGPGDRRGLKPGVTLDRTLDPELCCQVVRPLLAAAFLVFGDSVILSIRRCFSGLFGVSVVRHSDRSLVKSFGLLAGRSIDASVVRPCDCRTVLAALVRGAVCLRNWCTADVSRHTAFTWYSHSIHTAFTQHSHSIHTVFTQYSHSIHCKNTKNSHMVHGRAEGVSFVLLNMFRTSPMTLRSTTYVRFYSEYCVNTV